MSAGVAGTPLIADPSDRSYTNPRDTTRTGRPSAPRSCAVFSQTPSHGTMSQCPRTHSARAADHGNLGDLAARRGFRTGEPLAGTPPAYGAFRGGGGAGCPQR